MLDTILENIAEPLYALTILVALWRYPKYFNTGLKYFPIMVIYTFLTELLAGVVSNYPHLFSLSFHELHEHYNIFIYNIYDIIYFLYFIHLFWAFCQKELTKKWILGLGIAYLVSVIINMLFQNILNDPQLYSYTFGSIALVIAIIFFMTEIKWNPSKDVPYKNIIFWLGLGLIIFHIGYTLIRSYIHLNGPTNPEYYIWLRRLHLSLIVVMYSCFIVGFIKMKKNLHR